MMICLNIYGCVCISLRNNTKGNRSSIH